MDISVTWRTVDVWNASLIGEVLYTVASGPEQVLDQLKTPAIQTQPIPGHHRVCTDGDQLRSKACVYFVARDVMALHVM